MEGSAAPTSFLLSPEELSSLETNSLLLKLSVVGLTGDFEDGDLEDTPFFSTFPFTCFSCFFFFFFDFSLNTREPPGTEVTHSHHLGPCLWDGRAMGDLLTPPWGSAQAPP